MRTALLLWLIASSFQMPLAPSPDVARSCPGYMETAPCAEYWMYDTVFIGKVRSIVNKPFPEKRPYHWQEYQEVTATVSVEEVFRGSPGSEVVFEMADCYFEFDKDKRYLIYTNKEKDGTYDLQRYRTRSRLLSEAAEDLDFIRGLPEAPSGGRVYGTVYDYRENVTLRVNNEPYASNRKMPGVTIFLRSGERTYRTISDATGDYEFSRVEPGTYELSSDLPEFLSGIEGKVTVTDKACAKVALAVQATGEIRGRLINAKGEPVENAVVSIFSAEGVTPDMFDRVKAHYMTRDETGKDGSFQFVRLSSGRYHLAVNMVDEERRQGSGAAAYPRIFYPGVTDYRYAKAIVLGDGLKLEGVEIKLPALVSEKTAIRRSGR